MSQSKFLKGSQVIINGSQHTLLRMIVSDVWQLEEVATGELKRLTYSDLLNMYLSGVLKFPNRGPFSQNGTEERQQRLVKQFSSLPPEEQEKARGRLAYVKEILDQCGSIPGRSLADAVIHRVWERMQWPKAPPHYTTVWRWMGRYLPAGKDIRALANCRSVVRSSRQQNPSRLLEIVDESIDTIYLQLERKTIQATYEHAVAMTKRENNLRVASDQLPMPTLRLVRRRIEKIPAYDRHVARFGKIAADIRYRSLKAFPRSSRILERVEIDHTRMDVFVIDEKTMLPLGRPWLTLAVEYSSRAILGFDLGFDPPSYLTVSRCLRHAVLPKGNLSEKYPGVKGTWPMHGIMEVLVCDNGAEFHSESLEVSCLNMGIDIQYCPRKQPWFKGTVERLLGSLNRGVAHGVPGTTFANIYDKADYDVASKATITLGTLKEILHIWIIDYYHQRPHKGISDTPAHAWMVGATGIDLAVPSDPEELTALLGTVETRKLTHKGIEFHGLSYNSPELQALSRRIDPGFSLTVRYQGDNLGDIHVLIPDLETYVKVPALDQDYARNLSVWQHKLCRRFARINLNGRTDVAALGEAKIRMQELIEQDFERKKGKAKGRSYRFLNRGKPSQESTDPSRPSQPSDHPGDVASPPRTDPDSVENRVPPVVKTRKFTAVRDPSRKASDQSGDE